MLTREYIKRIAILTVALAAVLILALPTSQAEGPASSDEKLIMALENAWNQAELHHDAKAAGEILADSFFSVDHHGKVLNRTQYLADLKDESFHPDQISNENPKVYMYGDTAIFTSAYRTRGKDAGTPFTHHGRFTDTWVKINGRWLCVADQETLISN